MTLNDNNTVFFLLNVIPKSFIFLIIMHVIATISSLILLHFTTNNVKKFHTWKDPFKRLASILCG